MNPAAPIRRKTVSKRLFTGQKIALTPQDERMLKIAYEHIAGYHKRSAIELLIERKRDEISNKKQNLPLNIKLNSNRTINPAKEENVSLSNPGQKSFDMSSFNDNTNQFPIDLRTEDEKKVDEYHQCKDELLILEEKLKSLVNNDPKISYKDIETLGKKLGVKLSKQSIEHMIWEVDEDSDQLISWDEVQLTYCRNMANQTDIEPNSFFRLIEFLTFDEMNKGYIIEDDCMEMLFARYGSGKLENELTLIFGKKLRSQGGDGTLDLAGYLAAAQGRIGRRSLVT